MMNIKNLAKNGAAAALLLLGIFVVMIGIPDGGSEWTTTVFEEAVDIERDPDHMDDRSPFNLEPFHITISSKTGQTINAADVLLTWSYEGKIGPEGGYAFKRIDQTSMEVEIPGYPGGYTVQYWIRAYDEVNHPLTSTTYSYTVIMNGSWKDTDFYNNINMDWGPQEPKNGESVIVNITSIDNEVALERADLIYNVNFGDEEEEPIPGVFYFERINATVMTAEIIPYPAGSRISFTVEVYDQYQHKITSDQEVYSYPERPDPGTIYLDRIFIQLRDISLNGAPPKQATVTISNDTYSYEMEAVNGVAFSNISVYEDEYTVMVEYERNEEKITETFDISTEGGRFSFEFEINKKTYQVSSEEEERPYIMELVGLLLVIVLAVLSFIGAVRIKDLREEMNEKRKRSRKSGSAEEEKIFEHILKDEELKEKIVRSSAVLILSLLGLFFAPFFPWWMVIILSAFLTGIAWRFPYISMLVLAVLVTSAASYQSTEMGWVFLVFSLIVMVGGFFDWRYAYLSFLTVFAAGFGLGFAVPIIAAVVFSLFMGTVVWITTSLFLLVVAPSGTFQFFSLLASPEHNKSFIQFQRGVDAGWSPIDVVNRLGDLTYVDMDTISTVLTDTMGSLVPMFGLIGWGLAMLAGYLIFKHLLSEDSSISAEPKRIGIMLIPGGILLLFGVISIIWAEIDLTIWLIFGLLAVLPASIIPFGIRRIGEEALPLEYGVEEVVSSDVGKKVSEMVGFRKASFKDIGGLEEVKREVKNALMVPLLEPEMATKYGVKPSKGVLMFGPPGCGKTLMLRAVASDLNVDMIGIKCSDVMSKWYGESEGLIAGLFEEARSRSPCILFLDEIDAIAKRRDFYSTDDVTPRVLSIMLSEMDGMDDAEGIIIVATTNMPDLVDPALMRPGRFDKVMYVPPPDRKSREEILKVHMKGKYISDDIDVAKLARGTKGFSGADLANLVREASSLGLERALETKKPQPITMMDVEEVLSEIKPSITSKMIKMYDKLRKEFERKKKKGPKKKIPKEEEIPMEEGKGIPEVPKMPKNIKDPEDNKTEEETGDWEEM